MDTVPSVWQFHLQVAQPLPPSLRLAVAGGEKLEVALAQRLLETMPPGAALYNAYGPAECTVEASARAPMNFEAVMNESARSTLCLASTSLIVCSCSRT